MITGPEIDVVERMRSRPVNPAPVHPFVIRPPTGDSVPTTKVQADPMSQLRGADSVHVGVSLPLPSSTKKQAKQHS